MDLVARVAGINVIHTLVVTQHIFALVSLFFVFIGQ